MSDARYGVAKYGQAAYGIVSSLVSHWELAIATLARSLTLRKRSLTFIDPTTGWHMPRYTESSIDGVLEQLPGSYFRTAAGVSARQDAVMRTLYGVEELDQILDPKDNTRYEAMVGGIEVYYYPYDGSFGFRLVHLRKLDLYDPNV